MSEEKPLGKLINDYITVAKSLEPRIEALRAGALSFMEIRSLNARVKDLVSKFNMLLERGFNPELNGLPHIEMDLYVQERDEALRSAGVRAEVLESVTERSGVYCDLDENLVLAALGEQVEDLHLVSLEVEAGKPVYLLPHDLLDHVHPALKKAEVVNVDGLEESVIEMAAALYGGQAYPRLHDAITAAKQLS